MVPRRLAALSMGILLPVILFSLLTRTGLRLKIPVIDGVDTLLLMLEIDKVFMSTTSLINP